MQFGCRPELRQLHPLLRQPRSPRHHASRHALIRCQDCALSLPGAPITNTCWMSARNSVSSGPRDSVEGAPISSRRFVAGIGPERACPAPVHTCVEWVTSGPALHTGRRQLSQRALPSLCGRRDPHSTAPPDGMAGPLVCRTPRISCEAVPPSVPPAGAQGGTSACRTGAALSFVSCIRLFGGASAPLLARVHRLHREWESAFSTQPCRSTPS